jgi:hypothetical protein
MDVKPLGMERSWSGGGPERIGSAYPFEAGVQFRAFFRDHRGGRIT